MTMAEIPTAPPAYNLHDDDPEEEIGQTEEITTDMKKCYSLSRTVKYLATIDLFFATMYAFFNYYFFAFYTIITSLVSYNFNC